MSKENMFDILMEIRKVDKQISESKLALQKSQQDFIALERKLNHVKELQTKATKVYYEMQKREEMVNLGLKQVHKKYDATMELLSEKMEIDEGIETGGVSMKIEELKKHRDLMKQKLAEAESEREKLLGRINDIEIQTSIQEKKNAAMKTRLQKCLQELLQDEKKLEDELKSITDDYN